MTFSRSNWQEAASIAAWLVAAFLVLAFVNALRGTARLPIPPNPQVVQRPGPDHRDGANDGRSAHVSRTRRE